MLLQFGSWASSIELLPRIVAALAKAGLRLSLQKTELMAHPDTLRLGREIPIPDDHILTQIPWTSQTKYLRKPFRHVDVGENLYMLFRPTIRRAVHQGLSSLQPVLKGLTWNQPSLALSLCNKYIGAKWLWLAPVLSINQSSLQDIQVLQVTVLVCLLKLYLPVHLKHATAMSLHRIRRRATMVFLSANPAGSWTFMTRQRTWGYMGHLLRKPVEHLTRQALVDTASAQRPQGGLANTPGKWLTKTASAVFMETLGLDSVVARAAQREDWCAKGRSHFMTLSHVESHSRLGSGVWGRWQDALLQHVPWMFSMVLLCGAEGYQAHWIDETHGMQGWQLDSEISVALRSFLLHVRMLYENWVFLLNIPHGVWDAICSELHAMSAEFSVATQCVVLFVTFT